MKRARNLRQEAARLMAEAKGMRGDGAEAKRVKLKQSYDANRCGQP